jgi:colicin import membrane protein
VDLVTIAQIVFAVTAAVTALSLAGAAFDRLGRRLLTALAILIGAAAVASWVALAFRPGASLAVVAGGMTLAFGAELVAVRLRDLLHAAGRVDEQLVRAQSRLHSLVAREAEERAVELELVLARARADSTSLLAEQERRIAEERRAAAAERSQVAGDELSVALSAAQQQVEARFNAWTDDLERAQHGVAEQLAQLAHKQKQLISEAEARIAADAERLENESEQQRAGLVRLRDDLTRATQETVTSGASELESFAAERRRALHELNERMRRRERQMSELIEREETDAMRRIQAGFADVERKQIEQLDRILKRATSSYSDAAAQQFADTVRGTREAAATRLSRELDRSVQAFAREAQTVLAERLSQVGDTGAQRLERRLAQVTEGLERQRAEAMTNFEARLIQAEQDLRRRLDILAADTETERAVLEARLRELARKIDETLART